MIIVQKFGGTSMGSVERIKNVANKVIQTKEQGHNVVVVVSAMAGETDRLLNLAHEISSQPSRREMDMLLATGEQVSISLLSIALRDRGYQAKSFTGHQVRITTDSFHTKARIQSVDTERIKEELAKGVIVVVAGFQGVDEKGEITTLGRGGSDTTGVALAAILKAETCEIYTDVDGVYTSDPGLVPEAKKIDRISYDEMLELASLGAKVLQIRAVEFGKKHGVPIHVRSSFSQEPGTWVVEEEPKMEDVLVRGVAYNRNEAQITISGVPDQPGLAASIFDAIAKEEITVDMIVQNVGKDGLAKISFTVPKDECSRTVEVLRKVGEKNVEVNDKIAKLSVVGVGMRSHSGVAATMFNSLASEGINIMMISTSEIAISCVVNSKYTELGVRALHEAFGLSENQQVK